LTSGFRVQGSGFSAAAGKKTAGQIEKETLKKRISNNDIAAKRHKKHKNKILSLIISIF